MRNEGFFCQLPIVPTETGIGNLLSRSLALL
jgi:hypothetical protein